MQPLLEGSSPIYSLPAERNLGGWYKFKRACGLTVSKERRRISLNGNTTPSSFFSNKVNNQKYNLVTFLPLVLYNEFKFFFNLFFLLIALSQCIPFLKVGKVCAKHLFLYRILVHIYRTAGLCFVCHYVQGSV